MPLQVGVVFMESNIELKQLCDNAIFNLGENLVARVEVPVADRATLGTTVADTVAGKFSA